MARTPLWYGQASSHSRICADFPVCPLLRVNSRQLDSSQGLGDPEVLQLLLGVHEFSGTLSALDRAIPEQRLYKQLAVLAPHGPPKPLAGLRGLPRE